MGRKKIQIQRITDERNRQVSDLGGTWFWGPKISILQGVGDRVNYFVRLVTFLAINWAHNFFLLSQPCLTHRVVVRKQRTKALLAALCICIGMRKARYKIFFLMDIDIDTH